MAGEIRGIKTKDGVTRQIDFDYLANKPFGEVTLEELIENETLTAAGESGMAYTTTSLLNGTTIREGDLLEVTVDGDTIESTVTDTGNGLMFGDEQLIATNGAEGSFAGVVMTDEDGVVTYCAIVFGGDDAVGDHTVSISRKSFSKIPAGYMPENVVTRSILDTVLSSTFSQKFARLRDALGNAVPVPCGVTIDAHGAMHYSAHAITLIDFGDIGSNPIKFSIESGNDGQVSECTLSFSDESPRVKIIASGDSAYALVYTSSNYSQGFLRIEDYSTAYRIDDWGHGLFRIIGNDSFVATSYYATISSVAVLAYAIASTIENIPFYGGGTNTNISADTITVKDSNATSES